MTRLKLSLLPLFLLAVTTYNSLHGQDIDNKFQFRSATGFSKEIFRELKFTVTPELRFNWGGGLDRFMLTNELEYDVFKFMSVSGYYCFMSNRREGKSTEILNRYQFSTSFETKILRFEPELKLSYTNYTDEDEDGKYLRYKASVAYDIQDCRITPDTGFEIFHKPSGNYIFKYRYMVGAKYKFSDKVSMRIAYKLDIYMTQYTNRHIVDAGLKVRF